MKHLFVSILIFAYLMYIFIFEVAIHLVFPFKFFSVCHLFLKAEAKCIILSSFMCCFLLLSTELLSLVVLYTHGILFSLTFVNLLGFGFVCHCSD